MSETLLKESSVLDSVNLIAASGVASYPFSAFNEKITIEDIGLLGQPRQQVDSSAAAVLLGNCENCHIRRASTDRVHGFSFYLGGNNDAGYTSRDSSITDCVVKGSRTQAVGTISGSGIRTEINTFSDINPAIDLRTDIVTNGTATVSSAGASFGAYTTVAGFRLTKTGQTLIEGSVLSATNATTLVLSVPVPYTATGATLEITGTTAAQIDV